MRSWQMPFPGSCSLYGVKFKTYWYVHCLPIFHQRRLDSPDLSAQKDSMRTINTEDTQILYQYGWFNACHWLWFHPGTASLLYTTLSLITKQAGEKTGSVQAPLSEWVVLGHLLGRSCDHTEPPCIISISAVTIRLA